MAQKLRAAKFEVSKKGVIYLIKWTFFLHFKLWRVVSFEPVELGKEKVIHLKRKPYYPSFEQLMFPKFLKNKQQQVHEFFCASRNDNFTKHIWFWTILVEYIGPSKPLYYFILINMKHSVFANSLHAICNLFAHQNVWRI